MTPSELAWAAGLFEGEGSIRINALTRRNLGHLVASVTNTDIQVLEFFQERWPGYMKPATGMRPDQRPAFVWVVGSRKAGSFIRAILPYLVTDRVREKAEFGLAFQNAKTNDQRVSRSYEYAEEQYMAYLWMRRLNRRGNPPCPAADKFRGGRK